MNFCENVHSGTGDRQLDLRSDLDVCYQEKPTYIC